MRRTQSLMPFLDRKGGQLCLPQKCSLSAVARAEDKHDLALVHLMGRGYPSDLLGKPDGRLIYRCAPLGGVHALVEPPHMDHKPLGWRPNTLGRLVPPACPEPLVDAFKPGRRYSFPPRDMLFAGYLCRTSGEVLHIGDRNNVMEALSLLRIAGILRWSNIKRLRSHMLHFHMSGIAACKPAVRPIRRLRGSAWRRRVRAHERHHPLGYVAVVFVHHALPYLAVHIFFLFFLGVLGVVALRAQVQTSSNRLGVKRSMG